MKWVMAAAVIGLLTTLAAGAATSTPRKDQRLECELHKIKLQRIELPIVYGGPPVAPHGWTQSDSAAYRKAILSFIHANMGHIEGGCIPMEAKVGWAYVCPKCTKARSAWLTKHHLKMP